MSDSRSAEYNGTLKRLLVKDFSELPEDAKGLPEYFTVLDTGQILIWPSLDTAQVIFKCILS